jgi:hypothetical protein
MGLNLKDAVHAVRDRKPRRIQQELFGEVEHSI